MLTVTVEKLNISRIRGLNDVTGRIVSTALPFDQVQNTVSKPSQFLAAMPGDLFSNRVYIAEIRDHVCGYAIVRKRPDLFRWDVLVLGAGTSQIEPTDEVSNELWTALLDVIIGDGASRGVRRIFAQAPEQSTLYQSFQQSGFEGYSQQSILVGTPDPSVSQPEGFRSMHPSDVWSVHQLYNRSTPPVVQFAEAATSEDWEAPRYSLRARLKLQMMTTHQFVLDAAHGVRAYCRVSAGAGTTLVYFLAAEESKQTLYDFVAVSLLSSGISRKQLVKVAVSGYQYDCLNQFLAAGFRSMREQINLVKHTTVPLVIHPRMKPLPVIDRAAQAASGISMTNDNNGTFARTVGALQNEHSRSELITH